MQRLTVAPRLQDFTAKAAQTINNWFVQVQERFGLFYKPSSVSATDLPTDQWGLWKNSTTGVLALVANDGGVLKSVVLNATVPALTITPVASATLNVAQTLTTATSTKVNFITEVFDTDSDYDATNAKFLPTTPGYYEVTSALMFDLVTGGAPPAGAPLMVIVEKNGIVYQSGVTIVPATAANYQVSVNVLLPLNGSTDFIEIFGFQNTGINRDILATPSQSYINVHYVRTL